MDAWAESLQANQDQAIAIQSQEVYDRYTVYLTGCADLLRQKHIDVNQFTMEK
ncbi:MAG: class I SAM-dependent methyltransferase [Mycobacterium sp.]